MTTSIYYDGECPFCARYVTLLRLKDSVGHVDLVDLRVAQKMKTELIEQGFDLDKGMVVEMDGDRIGGAEAINRLALLTTPSNFFNRVNKVILSSPILAVGLYPVLRAGRWVILFLLGREQLGRDDTGALARASIFSSMFALFSVFHFFNYMLEYQRFPPQLDQIFLLVAAICLFLKPQSARLLWLLMLASTISAIAQAPVSSNHTIVRNFVVLGYWLSFFYAMFKGLKWSDVFTNFTMAGQGSLLVMYFFGVFHKINTDFLNPETSCAVTLWTRMPAPLTYIDGPIMHYLAIYGTFAVEGLLVLMLFTRRFRHIAVVCGILFHLLLALSGYAMYISFTTLAISLHCLFLNEESSLQIYNSKFMHEVRLRTRNPIYYFLFIALILSLIVAGALKQYTLVTVLVFPLILPFCYAIMRYGASRQPLLKADHKMSAGVIGAFLTTAFFLNCAMPYMGLKSAQTINMFANIRLEGGVSNHLIFKNPPGPFGYLEDVVRIDTANSDKRLVLLDPERYGIVYYELLDFVDKNPDAFVSYELGGESFTQMNAEKLSSDIETILHPVWFRKWFHFQQVDLIRPEPCYR